MLLCMQERLIADCQRKTEGWQDTLKGLQEQHESALFKGIGS